MIVKVCGMREPGNIRAVERLGADWMGFILWPHSSRRLGAVPCCLPRCCRVGVFVDPADEDVVRWSADLGLSYIQLHGDESPARCRQVHDLTGLPVIKAIPVSQPCDMERALGYGLRDGVAYLLFDTKCASRGGSGQQFDWSLIQSYAGELPFLLSGGIGPADAPRICQFRHPLMAGVDVNSRFESAPGLKDPALLKTFIHQIRQYEQNQQDIL